VIYRYENALADMRVAMEDHPSWKRYVEGTPLAHDIPAIAALLMLTKIGEILDALSVAQ
jgi:hypothetical protein